MPTRAADGERASTATAARGAGAHASAIARLEVRLALLELKQKLATMGVGAGLAAGAALLGFFAVAFALATMAAGIDVELPLWGALLIMTGFLLAVTAGLVLLARRSFRRGLPPTPEQAIEEARLTAEALTTDGNRRAG
jgi:membrane protein